MDARVDDKVALVTGGSRGIGRAIVDELLASGARGVVITGRKPDGLAEVVEEIGSDRVHAVAGNAADDDHVDAAVAAAVSTFGACDLLVNNAGTNPSPGHLGEVDLGAVDKTWAVNLRAPLAFAQAAWRHWMKDHGGAIVSIGSVGGLQPQPVIGAYNVSKAAVHYLTRQLAHDMAPTVRVNAVAAAIVKTKLSQMLWSWDPERVGRAHPLGRLGEPEDVARAVVFLLSDAATWITGVVLPVDGGMTGAASGFNVPQD